MSNQLHPLAPPDELLEHWRVIGTFGNWQNALTLAYRAGADQELEEVLVEMKTMHFSSVYRDKLRAARRPSPPSSLKERIAAAITDGDYRTALSLLSEALPND